MSGHTVVGAPPRRYLSAAVWIGCLLVLCFGALWQNQATPVILLVAAVIGAVIVFGVSLQHLLCAEYALCLVIGGLAHFYLGIRSVFWLVYILAVAIFLRFLVDMLRTRRITLPHRYLPLILLALFQGSLLAASLASPVPLADTAVGLKLYLPLWLIAIVIAFRPVSETFVMNLEKGALWLVVAQVPFVFEQHFSYSDWDTVVGTFGGAPGVGGCSATVMLTSIMAILVAIKRYQTGLIRKRMAAFYIGIAFLLLLSGETKAVLFLLPLALLVQQFPLLVRNPRIFAKAVPVVLAALGAVFLVYNQLYWTQTSEGKQQTLADRSLGNTFSWDSVNESTGDVGRIASIAIWLVDRRTDTVHRIMGYGAGATREPGTTAAPGIIGVRFAPAAIGNTTVGQLLWEGGVFGVFLYMSLVLSVLMASLRLARRAADEPTRARMRTFAAVLTVLFIFQFYNCFLTTRPTEHIILATLTAVIVAARPDGTFLPGVPADRTKA
jgi:hypothetical protein